MGTIELRDGKSVADVVHEYFPTASDDEIGFIVWNKTGWPCFWKDSDVEKCFREQLARYAEATKQGKDVCYGCGNFFEPRQGKSMCLQCSTAPDTSAEEG